MAPGPQQLTGLRSVGPEDAAVLSAFLLGLPEGDRTFFKEDADVATIERWCRDEHAARFLLVGDDGVAQGFLAGHPRRRLERTSVSCD